MDFRYRDTFLTKFAGYFLFFSLKLAIFGKKKILIDLLAQSVYTIFVTCFPES